MQSRRRGVPSVGVPGRSGGQPAEALAYLVALTKQTPPKFFREFITSGFKFDKMVAKDVARESSGPPAQTLAESSARVGDSTAPPGPVDSWIGEFVVHGADIRRPLGIDYSPPVATTRQGADFYKTTDTDWSHGSGAEVCGPLLSLVQAMTGRSIALSDLTGDGPPALRGKRPAT
jgi:hypothetical protein